MGKTRGRSEFKATDKARICLTLNFAKCACVRECVRERVSGKGPNGLRELIIVRLRK